MLGVFKAIGVGLKIIGSVVRWFGTHLIAGALVAAAAVTVARRYLPQDHWFRGVLEDVGLMGAGAVFGGWVAGTLGYWLGAMLVPMVAGRRVVVSRAVEYAAYYAAGGWLLAGVAGIGPISITRELPGWIESTRSWMEGIFD